MDKEYILNNLSTLSVEEIVKAILEGVVTVEEIMQTGEMTPLKRREILTVLDRQRYLSRLTFDEKPEVLPLPKPSSPTRSSPKREFDIGMGKVGKYAMGGILGAGLTVGSLVFGKKRKEQSDHRDSKRPKLEKVYSAVYAPSSAELYKWFKVQVHLYKESEVDRVNQKAKEMDEKACCSGFNPLRMPIKRGMQVDAEIQIFDEGVQVAKTTKSLLWDEELTTAVFLVKAVDPRLHSVAGDVVLSVGGVLVAEFSFNTGIVTADLPVVHYELSKSKRFKKAFISYSHKDVETAEFAVKLLKTLGINYFFDHHSLETGSVFDEEIMRQIEESDVFYLFWSQNAAESDYVEKEYTHAAQFAYPQKQPKSAATLVFKPFIIEPRPQGFPAALSEYTFSEMPHKH